MVEHCPPCQPPQPPPHSHSKKNKKQKTNKQTNKQKNPTNLEYLQLERNVYTINKWGTIKWALISSKST